MLFFDDFMHFLYTFSDILKLGVEITIANALEIAHNPAMNEYNTEPTPSLSHTSGWWGRFRARRNATEPSWDDSLRAIIIAFILAMIFRSVLFEPFHIPSGSMKDGLLVGDYVFVSKYSYGYSRYSFPLGLPLFEGRTSDNRPQRGDVVVFRGVGNQSGMAFIKRVIGLPGDVIEVREGRVFLNGALLPRTPAGVFAEDASDTLLQAIQRYTETIPVGGDANPVREYSTLDITSAGEWDNAGPYKVPAQHYFMMGDNRDNSTDSRALDYLGYVPAENLIGKAQMVLFSVEDAPIWAFWEWPWSLRGERFFKTVR